MAFRWRADDGPTLNAGLLAAIFQGIRACIARKPYIFVVFQGGPDPLPPPPLWIRTWVSRMIRVNMCSYSSPSVHQGLIGDMLE